ncbi:MAG: transcriptional regulator [Rhodoferax sp.]|nr:transcriptional regulator [Rhodoferax sp.]
MAELDGVLHQPIRLKIMAALKACPPREALDFVALKAIVGATDGNLGAHLTTLEAAGHIQIEKDFVGKKPRTRVQLTRSGRRAFDAYVELLRGILDGDVT